MHTGDARYLWECGSVGTLIHDHGACTGGTTLQGLPKLNVYTP